jgi:two-component system, chemotaxis family, protein-glutamate methylesterase/glutaminase
LNALEYMEPDYVTAAADIGPLISGLIERAVPEKNKLSEEEMKRLKMEVIIATKDNAFEMGIMNEGELTPFTCPQCHGVLVRLRESNIIRFRCHTGHAYTASSLLAEVSEVVESQLWQCMRGLEEMNMLLETIADHFEELKKPEAAKVFRGKSEESAKRAQLIHDAVLAQNQYSEDLRFAKKE